MLATTRFYAPNEAIYMTFDIEAVGYAIVMLGYLILFIGTMSH